MRIREFAVAAFILSIALAACAPDSETSTSVCGEGGEELTVDSGSYCVYEQAVVVENGFECPPELPNLTEAGGIGICAKKGVIPSEEIERIAERYRENHPAFDDCILDFECAADEVCDAGTCRPAPANNGATNNGATNNGTTNNGTTNNGTTNNGTTNNGTTNNGVECGLDAECAFGETCSDGMCVGACGGFAGFTCEANEWCDFADDEVCGNADFIGVCRPRPEVCTDQVDPVCGCDSMTYSNECNANAAGVDISATGACEF